MHIIVYYNNILMFSSPLNGGVLKASLSPLLSRLLKVFCYFTYILAPCLDLACQSEGQERFSEIPGCFIMEEVEVGPLSDHEHACISTSKAETGTILINTLLDLAVVGTGLGVAVGTGLGAVGTGLGVVGTGLGVARTGRLELLIL